MHAWEEMSRLWTKRTKKECDEDARATKEIIKEKLMKGENFTYFWFISEGSWGEGLSFQLTVPPIDTGIILTWQRKTQTGDHGQGRLEYFPLITNIEAEIFGQ